MERRAASQPKTPPTTLEERRKALVNTWREGGPEVFKVEDRRIPGPGGEIPVRIYWPSGGGPFPALMLFHGGSFIRGNIDTYDGISRRLCAAASCVVVNVDYRLAPENKFPAAPEDCYGATKWVADNAASINVDPTKIVVQGSSAGGNLAAVVALMARDRGGPSLVLQVLLCPASQEHFTPQTDVEEEAKADSIWRQYLRNEADAANPYACPMYADLRGLPPALVITAEYDSLRDAGEAYAEKLRQAGVPTTSKCYEGMFHIFYNFPASIDSAKAAEDQEVDALKVVFAGQPVPGAR